MFSYRFILVQRYIFSVHSFSIVLYFLKLSAIFWADTCVLTLYLYIFVSCQYRFTVPYNWYCSLIYMVLEFHITVTAVSYNRYWQVYYIIWTGRITGLDVSNNCYWLDIPAD